MEPTSFTPSLPSAPPSYDSSQADYADSISFNGVVNFNQFRVSSKEQQRQIIQQLVAAYNQTSNTPLTLRGVSHALQAYPNLSEWLMKIFEPVSNEVMTILLFSLGILEYSNNSRAQQMQQLEQLILKLGSVTFQQQMFTIATDLSNSQYGRQSLQKGNVQQLLERLTAPANIENIVGHQIDQNIALKHYKNLFIIANKIADYPQQLCDTFCYYLPPQISFSEAQQVKQKYSSPIQQIILMLQRSIEYSGSVVTTWQDVGDVIQEKLPNKTVATMFGKLHTEMYPPKKVHTTV